jgi:hypothetical protein
MYPRCRYPLSGSMILALIRAHLLYRSRSVAIAFWYGNRMDHPKEPYLNAGRGDGPSKKLKRKLQKTKKRIAKKSA